MNLGIIMTLIIVAIFIALSLKSRNAEISGLISLAVCICIIFLSLDKLKVIIKTLDKIKNDINIDGTYFILLLKMIGVAYICEFASGITKDAGYNAVSGQVDTMGRLTMIMISLPVLLQVINTVLDLL